MIGNGTCPHSSSSTLRPKFVHELLCKNKITYRVDMKVFFFFISLWKSFASSPFCTLAAVGSLNRFPFLMLFISLCPSLTADFPRFNHSCGHRASEAWLYPWAVKQKEQQLEVTEMLHFAVEIANRQATTKNLSRLPKHLTQISSLIHIYTNISLEDYAAGA